MRKIIIYYQTFVDLSAILVTESPVSHIHLSAVHFGRDDNERPYIHLNDYIPTDKKFDTVWRDMERAVSLGIKVKVMLGGAGGAFQALFSDFNTYYPLLLSFLQKKAHVISGIDLDVEEETGIDNIKMVIRKLKSDMGSDFQLSMAPVQFALETNNPGIGGFSYGELMQSEEGKMIEYFNGQFYSSYETDDYDAVIKNKYNPSKIIMGMCGDDDLDEKLEVIHKLYLKYGENFGGVFLWEYSLANPDWAFKINKLILRHTTNNN
jgi:hypothetical protein